MCTMWPSYGYAMITKRHVTITCELCEHRIDIQWSLKDIWLSPVHHVSVTLIYCDHQKNLCALHGHNVVIKRHVTITWAQYVHCMNTIRSLKINVTCFFLALELIMSYLQFIYRYRRENIKFQTSFTCSKSLILLCWLASSSWQEILEPFWIFHKF